VHRAGEQAQSDFTDMRELAVTIAREPFPHLLYHFVLTYSNWEWAQVYPSESFESLNGALQAALWCLDGVPEEHRTDISRRPPMARRAPPCAASVCVPTESGA